MTGERFTYFNTTGWNKDGFLNVMNGLNEKNKKLQKENEELKKELEKISLVNELLSMDLKESEHELWKENEQLKHELLKRNKSGIYRVKKMKDDRYAQGYYWRYSYLVCGRKNTIDRADLGDLKEEVLRRGLEWIER